MIAACAAVVPAVAQYHIDAAGEFAPNGTSYPWSHLRALCGAPDAATVDIAGTLFESGTFDRPMTLQKAAGAGGHAVLGAPIVSSTSIELVSYNMRLWPGGALGLPNCRDTERAVYHGINAIGDTADVITMQEVWDGPFYSDNHFQTIAALSAYPHGLQGSDVDPPAMLDSGLGMLSRFPLSDVSQVRWQECNGGGWDCAATKGFLRGTFYKNGFGIAVFTLHTQAGTLQSDVDTRWYQLSQLSSAVFAYRLFHPTHAVIVTGDFNVPGETSEYYGNMRTFMGANGGRDTALNERCGDYLHCTKCCDNDLTDLFSDPCANERLDYMIYYDSFDGSVRVQPTDYTWFRWQVPTGFPDVDCHGITTRDISDHDAIRVSFELKRVN
jgi:endonuclease/exonuclease/phosphatase family metal-dependent hydrolase